MGNPVSHPFPRYEVSIMLYTIVAVLLLLWLIGQLTAYTAGGLIHLLLVVAVIVMLVRIIQGRKPV